MFTVSLAPKALHPQAHRIPEGAMVWAINGYVGARLNLRRGVTYYFNVTQPAGTTPLQSFYLTGDIQGGVSDVYNLDIQGTTPVTNGVLALKVDARTPSSFYYQSNVVGYGGGSVIVH